MAQKAKKKRTKAIIIVPIIFLLAVLAAPWLCRLFVYPKAYEEYVEKYSGDYGVDENFIYAVINTESGFDENAKSNVGAVGLMQIMEDAFKWTKRSLDAQHTDIEYADMLTPEYNIEYGCCMLGYYYKKYGSYELSAAAYHAGTNQVDIWLDDGTIDANDIDIDDIPSDATAHYVRKVMRAYEAYKALY